DGRAHDVRVEERRTLTHVEVKVGGVREVVHADQRAGRRRGRRLVFEDPELRGRRAAGAREARVQDRVVFAGLEVERGVLQHRRVTGDGEVQHVLLVREDLEVPAAGPEALPAALAHVTER